MRFVHGVAPEEAATAVASAPRKPAHDPNATLERIEYLEAQVAALNDVVDSQRSRSGMRHRLVELVKELADVAKQKDDKWFSGIFPSAQEKEVLQALDQVESDLRQEISDLTARLRELADVS